MKSNSSSSSSWSSPAAVLLWVWVLTVFVLLIPSSSLASVIKRQTSSEAAATKSVVQFRDEDRPRGLKVVFATETSLRLAWTFDTSHWEQEQESEEESTTLNPPLDNATSSSSLNPADALNDAMNAVADVSLDGYRIFYKHNSYEDVKTIKTQLPAFRYELKGLGKNNNKNSTAVTFSLIPGYYSEVLGVTAKNTPFFSTTVTSLLDDPTHKSRFKQSPVYIYFFDISDAFAKR